MSVPKIISIEGNIGAGKTTIIEKLEKYLKNDKSIIFLREPVDLWQTITDEKGDGILTKFYADPNKYAFSFQVMAFVTRLTMLRNAVKQNPHCKLIICERSLEADKNIFAKMLFDDNMIEEINYKIYTQFYNEYRKDFQLEGIVYIDADADVCHNRVSKRSRTGEDTVKLEYLEKCKTYHDIWLNNPNLNILKVKTNEDVSYDINDPNDVGIVWLNDIKDFIYNIYEQDLDLDFSWIKHIYNFIDNAISN